MTKTTEVATTNGENSLVGRMAMEAGIEPAKYFEALKKTAFDKLTNEQILVALHICD